MIKLLTGGTSYFVARAKASLSMAFSARPRAGETASLLEHERFPGPILESSSPPFGRPASELGICASFSAESSRGASAETKHLVKLIARPCQIGALQETAAR
jgi:hypothetical protein